MCHGSSYQFGWNTLDLRASRYEQSSEDFDASRADGPEPATVKGGLDEAAWSEIPTRIDDLGKAEADQISLLPNTADRIHGAELREHSNVLSPNWFAREFHAHTNDALTNIESHLCLLPENRGYILSSIVHGARG